MYRHAANLQKNFLFDGARGFSFLSYILPAIEHRYHMNTFFAPRTRVCTYVVFRIQKRSFVKYSLLRIFLQVEDLGKALRSCHIISFFPRQDQMSIQKEPPRFIAAFIFFRRGEGGTTEKSPDHLTKSYGMLTCKFGNKKLLLSVSCGLCPKLQRNKRKYSKLSNFAS